ncbi:MAG: response regulator [Rhizobiales bacterium]|nr:response regulator [Hyphomicrobiales bacterium]
MITIVDDDEAVRDSLSVLLSLAGATVNTRDSGAAFLTALEVQRPDCLVVDVHMPRMSGLEMIEKLNELDASIPVILISGNMDDAIQSQADRIGVSKILKKPFSGHLLIEAIQDLLG